MGDLPPPEPEAKPIAREAPKTGGGLDRRSAQRLRRGQTAIDARLEARQLSRRVGAFTCILAGDRVTLIGGAVIYLEGEITI